MIDNYSKFGWTVPLKNKNSQTIKDFSDKKFISSKRSPYLMKTDRRKEFYNSFFQNFLNNINKKHYSRNSWLGVVFAEIINRTIRDFL